MTAIDATARVRWGIMSTANIARASFLPALAAAGGRAYAVAGRDAERTRQYAEANGIERALTGYDALLEDDSVEAVYIPLPNSLHAEWAIATLRAGKPVLCEKPLCLSVEETEQVLAVARETGVPLWEAFVFPFQPQFERLRAIVNGGEIGEVREIQSSFHFRLTRRQNIRLSPEMGGGSLLDVGCYPIHLAGVLWEEMPQAAATVATPAPEGVDEQMQGVVAYPSMSRLVFSCGFDRDYDTLTRVLGMEGEVRLTNAFHPKAEDTLTVIRGDAAETEPSGQSVPSFTQAIEHIQRVVRGQEEPRHLATEDSLRTAAALQLAAEASAHPHRPVP
jgi:predicted dehydrogenase